MDGQILSPRKFDDPRLTAKGEPRAHVPFSGVKTLWFNTGTLCNIACRNCYIESSPANDRFVYLTAADIAPFLDELEAAGETGVEIGFTGGEPFMAPDIVAMLDLSLSRGHSALVLTNAMTPMMRPRVQAGLLELNARFPGRLTLRVSLDHHTARRHDAERGEGGFDATLAGLKWLAANGFDIAVAGRSMWGDADADARLAYAALFRREGLPVDAQDPGRLVIFPEMTVNADPPEITTACWGVLNKSPGDIMCAAQRMVVKRKGEDACTVLPCTLLPYDRRFDMGPTLGGARREVSLNHLYCATFCVLGGGSCSA